MNLLLISQLGKDAKPSAVNEDAAGIDCFLLLYDFRRSRIRHADKAFASDIYFTKDRLGVTGLFVCPNGL